MALIVSSHIAYYWLLQQLGRNKQKINANGIVKPLKFTVDDVNELFKDIIVKISGIKISTVFVKEVRELFLETCCAKSTDKVLVFEFKGSNIFEYHDTQNCRRLFIQNRFFDASCKTIQLTDDHWLVCNSYFQSSKHVVIMPIYAASNGHNGLVFCVEVLEPIQNIQTTICVFLQQQASSHYKLITKRQDSDSHALSKDSSYLLHLCGDLNEKDPIAMQLKVISYICDRTNAEHCCILLVSSEMGQLMCQVSNDKVHDFECVLPLTEGIFAEVCHSKKPNILESSKQIKESDMKWLKRVLGDNLTSIALVPILSQSSHEVVAVVAAANKLDKQKFTTLDTGLIAMCLQYTWTVLTSALALKKERKAKDEFQAMLKIARNLFTRLDDVSILLGQIIQEARDLTGAERCSVFLVDGESKELVAKVFDGISSVHERLDPRQYDFEGMNEVRLPLTQGIAGHVATTGEILNIADAYSHPLFYRGIDESTGFKTRNILCFPIKDHNSVVVGVSQLCNKINGSCFTKYDEELANHFAIFSGISISHSLLYKQVIESNCRSQLANELMTYHMKANDAEVESCLVSLPDSILQFHVDFDKFEYPPRSLTEDKTIPAMVQIFVDLGLVCRFHISMKTLARFVIMVRRGYRDPPYHNWDHAFSVAHHSYLLAKNLDLCNVIGELETFALIAASLCHDLDHRGTNNAFQVSSQSVLAALYSSEGSVLEHHHFAQAMSILNIGNCNIFESLTKKDYVRVLDLMKEIILATDLGHHLSILNDLEAMATAKIQPSQSSKEEKNLIICLLMTSSDISDQTKDWYTTKSTAKLIYKEFFSQGDMEKSMGGSPDLINDRKRACVPQLQINFMKHIARPVYRILGVLFPPYQPTYERFESNVEMWESVLHEVERQNISTEGSLDFLTEEFETKLFSPVPY